MGGSHGQLECAVELGVFAFSHVVLDREDPHLDTGERYFNSVCGA